MCGDRDPKVYLHICSDNIAYIKAKIITWSVKAAMQTKQ